MLQAVLTVGAIIAMGEKVFTVYSGGFLSAAFVLDAFLIFGAIIALLMMILSFIPRIVLKTLRKM